MLGKLIVNVPLEKVNSCCSELLEHMRAYHSHICSAITEGRTLTPELKEDILSAARKYVNSVYPSKEDR